MPALEQPAGRQPRQPRARVDVETTTYDVRRFCDANNVSRTHLYRLWAAGRGPKFFKLGKHIRITAEASAEWRAMMEATAA